MLKLVKNGGVKMVDQNSSLVALLKHEGWVVEGDQSVTDAVVTVDAPRRGRPPKK